MPRLALRRPLIRGKPAAELPSRPGPLPSAIRLRHQVGAAAGLGGNESVCSRAVVQDSSLHNAIAIAKGKMDFSVASRREHLSNLLAAKSDNTSGFGAIVVCGFL